MLDSIRLRFKEGADRVLGRGLPVEPAVVFPTATLGDSSYGAWTFCPARIAQGGVIYSFGVDEDISWEIKEYGVTIHAFDPTPRSAQFVKRQTLPGEFIFHAYGIADYDGTASFYPPENSEWVSHTILKRRATAKKAIEVPVRRLETIMSSLGHERVDLIKMDIEGAEYGVIGDIVKSSPVAGGAEQLLVEFHHRFPGKGIADTKECIAALERVQFKSFHISPSTVDWGFVRCR